MANETVRAKVRLAGRLDVLARPGRSLLPEELHRLAPHEDLSALDTSQGVAACAIAGTDGLVTVTGPAGAGKTTMLRAAFVALRSQRRRMLVVAPTRKAASVACREVGAAAFSIHALLSDHGYRWGTDAAGAKVWTRLRVGEIDPRTGVVYGGPTKYVLRSRDRIVIDEAGMVDLQTANVLVELAIEQGVGLAFVGDTHQALPVGHAGAMGSAIRHANARSSSTRCTGSVIPTTRRSHCVSGMRAIASVRWWLRTSLPETVTSTESCITTRRVSG
ncbi:AAA family ATPase [Microbacterium sp. NPDC078428]|uniref:AAA family ATPase n=1 Tax=Microbacterium sp. NPDC078428 TaxID=3364190 RepID=UPI0037CC63F3